MSEPTYYEVIAVNYDMRKRVVIASDLTSDEADRTKREYINKHGLTATVYGKRIPAQIHIYRQRHAHEEFAESYTEVMPSAN